MSELTYEQLLETIETAILGDIAEMMSEFVENWPQPKKLQTALALIAKTMRAALDPCPENPPGEFDPTPGEVA